MGKEWRTRRHSSRKPVRLFLLLTAMCLLTAMGAAAMYFRSYQSGSGVVTSDAFYFAVDLLGDSRMGMVTDGGEPAGAGYRYQDVQEETWRLYGGGEHEITFQLRNYYDDLRITQAEIPYTVQIEAKTPEGNSVNGLAALLGDGGQKETVQNGTLGTETGGVYGVDTRDITLTIASSGDVEYKDGTEVIVTAESSAPYEKTIRIRFRLYTVSTYLCYEIRDSVGSPFAEMVLMADAVGTSDASIQPYLSWSKDLSIDNTNSLTFSSGTAGALVQQAGITNRNMQISRALKSRESESIYFFKGNVSDNYTEERTVVDKDEQGGYRIDIE